MTTIQETNLSLQNLQRRCSKWSDYNFGTDRTTAYRSLYGIIEEFGELVHSQLKMEQSIRGTAEEHQAKIRDAVGDIVFYLCDYLHIMHEDIAFDWPDPEYDGGKGELFEVVFFMQNAITDLCQNHRRATRHQVTRLFAGTLLSWLNIYCVRSGITMQTAVWETAEQVFTRNWRRFPKNGKTE